MDERNQQRIGPRTPKRSFRITIGKAIDLFVSAMAILLTGGVLLKFFKRRRSVCRPPRAISFMVSIPSAIKVFNWTATLYKGSIRFQTPMLYALGFIGLFTIGGLTGLFLACLALDVHLHDTYFVIAHFHYIMVGGMVIAYLGGLHFWWPKITGRMYPELPAKLAALTVFFGFNLTFFPQFILGYLGMPRRYPVYAPEFQVLNVLSTAGASILAIGYFLPLAYLLWSLRYGAIANSNPWDATGLEWTTSSPPPPDNFKMTPLVTEGPYNYDPQAAEPELGAADA